MSSEQGFEMAKEVWIRYVPDRGKFGIKITTYFEEERVLYAEDVNKPQQGNHVFVLKSA